MTFIKTNGFTIFLRLEMQPIQHTFGDEQILNDVNSSISILHIFYALHMRIHTPTAPLMPISILRAAVLSLNEKLMKNKTKKWKIENEGEKFSANFAI